MPKGPLYWPPPPDPSCKSTTRLDHPLTFEILDEAIASVRSPASMWDDLFEIVVKFRETTGCVPTRLIFSSPLAVSMVARAAVSAGAPVTEDDMSVKSVAIADCPLEVRADPKLQSEWRIDNGDVAVDSRGQVFQKVEFGCACGHKNQIWVPIGPAKSVPTGKSEHEQLMERLRAKVALQFEDHKQLLTEFVEYLVRICAWSPVEGDSWLEKIDLFLESRGKK